METDFYPTIPVNEELTPFYYTSLDGTECFDDPVAFLESLGATDADIDLRAAMLLENHAGPFSPSDIETLRRVATAIELMGGPEMNLCEYYSNLAQVLQHNGITP